MATKRRTGISVGGVLLFLLVSGVGVAARSGVVLASARRGAVPAGARSAMAAGARSAIPDPARVLVYVANIENAGSGPVAVYAAGSNGAVSPVRTVADPNKANTEWDPWGVTFDALGHLYVQSFLSDATTFVFPPKASGAAAPSRMFVASSPDNQSIAVDGKGYEYVAGGEGDEAIVVIRPGAHGKAADQYSVPALRTIPLDENFNPWPGMLATDARNQVLAAVVRPQGNAIEVFAGGAKGRARPVRVISGRDTGLGSCSYVTAPACRQLSIAFSARTARIYVAVSVGATTHISVFAGNAVGNARPIRTIEGPATGLAGKVITGIAVGPRNGMIYAMVKSAQFGAGNVIVFGRSAEGNARPLRSFTDSRSRFVNAAGLAISVAVPSATVPSATVPAARASAFRSR